MKVLNGTLWRARAPLKELLKERLPIKPAYWLTKLDREVEGHCATIEDCRVRLIRENGVPDEKGNIAIQPDTDAWRVVIRGMNELFAEQVEVRVEKIKLLANGDLHVAPSTLMALEEFLDIEGA